MIRSDGWSKYNIWEHSESVRELYTQRVRCEAEEMTSCAQAATLLAPLVGKGKTREILLDVGCGSGYFFHSLAKRNIAVDYYGIDACSRFVEIGKRELPSYGVPAENLRHLRIEDLDGEVDHVVCMNVISNIDNFHRPVERLLQCARKTVILRESVGERASTQYVRDEFLDPGVDLKVYVHTYDQKEFMEFIRSYGFSVEYVVDQRTNGEPELVINYPHHWKFFVARRL